MAFSIGSQHAATINNVDGDMVVHRLVSAGRWNHLELRAALERVEAELERAQLPADRSAAVREALGEVRAQAARDGDPAQARSALERATRLLKEAGALTGSGLALLGALRGAAAAVGLAA